MDTTGTKFDLRGKGLTLTSAADIEPFLSQITAPEKITEVHLSGNTLGPDAAAALGAILPSMTSLRVANFSDIFTRRLIDEIPIALKSLCDGLLHTSTLRELDLSGNAFGERVAPVLVPLLTTNRGIALLNLNNQGLGPAAGIILADALARAATLSAEAGEPSNLQILICGRNRLEHSAEAWGRALAKHTHLRAVHMPQNGIKADGFGALVGGLKNATSLRHLNLQDNWGKSTTGADGDGPEVDSWPLLADALAAWQKLAFLNVADCCLTPDAFRLIMERFEEGSHSDLATLIVDNSDLDEEVYEQLKDIVSVNLPGLRTLSLALNEDLECGHVEDIVQALEKRGGEAILDDDIEGERWPLPTELEEPTPVAVVDEPVVSTETQAPAAVPSAPEDELEEALAKLSLGK
ncbi:hypothetical protein HGRIS_014534 [Hohenbuehelia grisea]|uniref:RNI-like protein n=1 Tax=Hohenbuehelia grisea TaxID=104357 RepID=A0ABR3JV60_9AGAR